MMPVGFAMGGGIYIGNSLGEGRPRVAMQYYRVVLYFSIFITITQILALQLGLDIIVFAFTDQEPIG